MKKYLVTDKEVRLIDQILHIHSAGYTIEAEELPPGAKVLTREEVRKWLVDFMNNDNTKEEALDELFGETP